MRQKLSLNDEKNKKNKKKLDRIKKAWYYIIVNAIANDMNLNKLISTIYITFKVIRYKRKQLKTLVNFFI